MATPLSNFFNNLSERIHRIKCKYGYDDKKYDTCGIKYKYCDCFGEISKFKDDLIEYKYLCCNKNCQHKFNEILKKRFFNIQKFSNNGNKKFILLLQESVYPYEYMNDWKKFNEGLLPEKEYFYIHLLMQITRIQNEFVKILK